MYIFAVILFSALAYFEVFDKEILNRYKAVLILLCFSFLVFHDGFRWETGSDWKVYLEFFQGLTVNYGIDKSPFEIGYTLFMYLIRLLTDDYTVYLIFHALVFYSCFFYCIIKISNYPFVSILVFYSIILPYLGMNRQFLAMGLYAVGLVFLLQNKRLPFVGMIALGFLFHHTAILGLIALLCNKKLKSIHIIVLLLIALVISYSGTINKIALSLVGLNSLGDNSQIGEKLDSYTTEAAYTSLSIVSTLLSLFKKILWICLVLAFKNKIDNKDSKFYILFNLYLAGTFLYLIFNGSLFQVLVSRALLYFNITEMFIIPYVLTIFKQNYGKLIIMIILSLYCGINIQKGFRNYDTNNQKSDFFEPYKGIFINTNYKRNSI